MTATKRWTTHGLDVFDWPDVVEVWRGCDRVGLAFPVVVARPEGPWFGKLRGQIAQRFPTRHTALAHVVGGCPECTCEPVACAEDDSGDSCLNCGACMNECPEDECSMLKESR